MPPKYPLLWRLALSLLLDSLSPQPQRRPFSADARAAVQLLDPPLAVYQPENIPVAAPYLLLTNHYSRPGFQAWWIPLAISAVTPLELHWMMTEALTYLGAFMPVSRWVLRRVARLYGFTAAPPMPPHPRDVTGRARAVRQVLEIARSPGAAIALAPEGRDLPGGVLGPLPPGAGRFIENLAARCQQIIPVGVFEAQNRLCLRFGPAFELTLPPGLSAAERDQQAGQIVLHAIARQLPPALRGAYDDPA
jgi:1-acyl-sn-glycerol-3-phosphate acyltransferase